MLSYRITSLSFGILYSRENKYWTFACEEVNHNGTKRKTANANIIWLFCWSGQNDNNDGGDGDGGVEHGLGDLYTACNGGANAK